MPTQLRSRSDPAPLKSEAEIDGWQAFPLLREMEQSVSLIPEALTGSSWPSELEKVGSVTSRPVPLTSGNTARESMALDRTFGARPLCALCSEAELGVEGRLESKSCGDLVKHKTKGKNILAPIQRSAHSLFRGHVGNGADCFTRTAQELRIRSRTEIVSSSGFRGCFCKSSFASPKSRIFAWPRVVTKMFAGLMSR
jgi:hypothetical protein